jgi:hypothetical protein
MFFFKKILKKKKLFLFFLNGQKNVYFTRVQYRPFTASIFRTHFERSNINFF